MAEATEAAARKADELGVDLDSVGGTGSGGNITVEDVIKAAGVESKSGGPKKLAPADFRLDSFDPSVEGVKPLTQAGTEVPAGKVQEVQEAAARSNVKLKEVE